MTAQAAATNLVEQTPVSHVRTYGGISANGAIPVDGIEPWRTEAIQKVIQFGALPENWDGRGGVAPAMAVRQKAFEYLMSVPSIGAPRIVPTSGGGFHFEWSVGPREIEIYIEPDCTVEALRVLDGMPMDDNLSMNVSALFHWLVSK